VREGSRWSDPPFDWERRETWPAAFRGVEAVYVSYFPDLAVGAIAEAANRPIGFQEISSEQYAEGMVRARLPKDFVSLVNYLFTTVLDGRDAYLADGVQRALHRKPREFAAYARETVATGIWENQQ